MIDLLFGHFLDVLSNRKLLSFLIQKIGNNVIDFAEDGDIAVEAIKTKGNNYYDIIFMDNTMPRMVSLPVTINCLILMN